MNLKGEHPMNCPICNNSTGIEFDMHSDGYADNLFECTNCEAVWITTMDGTILLNKKVA
jgi:hypothetical protein